MQQQTFIHLFHTATFLLPPFTTHPPYIQLHIISLYFKNLYIVNLYSPISLYLYVIYVLL